MSAETKDEKSTNVDVSNVSPAIAKPNVSRSLFVHQQKINGLKKDELDVEGCVCLITNLIMIAFGLYAAWFMICRILEINAI